MSSFLLSASPWNSGSGSGGNTTRKRTSTIARKPKTYRRTDDESDADSVVGNNSDVSESFQATMAEQESRNSKVNQLLDKMNDAGAGLADFVPIAAPKEKFMGKTTLADLMPTLSNYENTSTDTSTMYEGFESPLMQQAAGASEFGPSAPNDRVLSNYMKSYESAGILGKPYYATSAGSVSSGNGDISQKLNYMTRILEELQMEKTSNITEELILYSFLGVFVIFVVDSFAKAGKYYR